MKVFISWSGEPSQKVADVLRVYLPRMIQSLEPFMSQRDLKSGGRWAHQLSQELDQSSFGIICLTPDNLAAPWLLFEAGALTKHVEGRACCLLFRELGPTDISDPLAQFQNRRFVKEEFWKLLIDLNGQLDKSLDPSDLQATFEKWWPDLEKEVEDALAKAKVDAPMKHKRDQSELLEELLVRVRNVERAIVERPLEPSPDFTEDSKRRRDILEELRNKRKEIGLSLHPFNLGQKLDSLSPEQRSLLKDFLGRLGGAATAAFRPEHLLQKYSTEDIERVIDAGFVIRQTDGNITLNPLLVEALAKHLLS